jgi:esterase/lipase
VLVQVQAVVQLVQNIEPASITPPTLTFFSDRDTTIDTAASRSLLTELHKGKIEFETLTLANGDGHVVAGDIMAPEVTQAVLARTLTFIRDNVVSLPASQH